MFPVKLFLQSELPPPSTQKKQEPPGCVQRKNSIVILSFSLITQVYYMLRIFSVFTNKIYCVQWKKMMFLNGHFKITHF